MYKKNKKIKKNNNKSIKREIVFEKEVAEDINKIISIFNSEYTYFKLNSSIFINIVLKDYFSYLKTLDENDAREIMKNNLLAYTLEGVSDE